ncbi:Stf0 family sulfotransferase [Rhizobium oryziradicis]|uniref:Sulfotransferase n=1 Tax=Rhizobium oryziradicis TaxID=1867956 RepID=A0A1Q8ZU73_9HYPH|nr:Stf0 family sulfotransferase [Rhizobium oryziradicis]OLP45641.1 sulfotransferase [Rhizobium oryziradicis]
MPKYASYIICTSPRSGSTLLCKLLAATGVSGNPGSYFHRPDLSDWMADCNLMPDPSLSEAEMLEAIFRAVQAKGSLDTGMFGLRLQRHSFEFFMEKLRVLHPGHDSDLQRLEAAFGRTLFIHLSRLDKVEQAVSCVKAEQTGLWHVAPDGTELERVAPVKEPVYDAAEIRATYDRFTDFDLGWKDWFEAQGIEPLRITYTTLSEDPVGCLRMILEALGVDADAANGVVPGVAKLADATNRDWVMRFRAELEAQ